MVRQSVRLSLLVTLGLIALVFASLPNLTGCGEEPEESPLTFPNTNTNPNDGIDDDDDNFSNTIDENDFTGDLPNDFPDDIDRNTFRYDKVSLMTYRVVDNELSLTAYSYSGEQEILLDRSQATCHDSVCYPLGSIYMDTEYAFWFNLSYSMRTYETYNEKIILDKKLAIGDYAFSASQTYIKGYSISIKDIFDLIALADDDNIVTADEEKTGITITLYSLDNDKVIPDPSGVETIDITVKFYWDDDSLVDESGDACTYDIKLGVTVSADATGAYWDLDDFQNQVIKRVFFQAVGRFDQVLYYSGGCPSQPIDHPYDTDDPKL